MKTLYFTKGPVATPQELAAAAAISGEVFLRNAANVGPTDCIEPCNAVAGDVPQIYIDFFKTPAGYFVDAPEDGHTYGRKDAAWNEVSGGGGGGLTPNAPPYYLQSMLVALPPASAPYELSSTPFKFAECATAANDRGSVSFTFLLELLAPGAFIINKKVLVGDIPATDYLTEQFRHSYTMKIYEAGTDIGAKYVSFDRYFAQNSAIASFLAGVPDPEDFQENELSVDQLAVLTLNAGKYLINLDVHANNRSQFFALVGFYGSVIGGATGGIFQMNADSFMIKNLELMPTE